MNELLLDDIITLVERIPGDKWMQPLHTVASFLLAAMRTDADFAKDRIVHTWSTTLNKMGERLPATPSTATTRMILKNLETIANAHTATVQQPKRAIISTEETSTNTYQEGPGSFRPSGPRHDNDHADYRKIAILPTVDEIVRDADPYLPRRMEEVYHVSNPVDKLLDRLFRLFRHDSLQPLMAAVKYFVSHQREIIKTAKAGAYIRTKDGDSTIILQRKVMFERIETDLDRGVVFWVSFNPAPGQGTSYWKEGYGRKILISGSIVVVYINDGTDDSEQNLNKIVIGTISSQIQPTKDHRISVGLTLVEHDRLRHCLSLILRKPTRLQMDTSVLFTIQNHFFTSVRPVLGALQSLSVATLPLQSSFLPNSPSASVLPKYMQSVDGSFCLDLRSILQPQAAASVKESFRRCTFRSPEELTRHLQSHASSLLLDKTQLLAFVAGMTQEISVIQGPPGCGKTYIGKKLAEALLVNINKPKSLSSNFGPFAPVVSDRELLPKGPVFCITYTNHALDQFLREIMDGPCGVPANEILRLGGQSKDPILQSCSLAGRKFDARNSREIQTRKHARSEANKRQTAIDQRLSALKAHVGNLRLADIESIIRPHQVKELKQGPLTEDYDRDYVKVGKGGKKITDPVQVWLSGADLSSEVSGRKRGNVWSMKKKERYFQAQHWIDRLQERAIHTTANYFDGFAAKDCADYMAGDIQVVRRIASQMRVIGMATSGAALNHALIMSLDPKIIICEEAGEVSETHLIASLAPGCEQLILIGDHKQLRPRVSYTMSIESHVGFDVDLSLFERLALKRIQPGTNDIKEAGSVITLHNQRRMHPDIAQLILPLYPELEDDASVSNYPRVRGMQERLWFYDHDHPESGGGKEEDAMSKRNAYEADMVVALVQHLVKQGYSPAQLALLATYSGQLKAIRQGLDTGNVAVMITEQTMKDEFGEDTFQDLDEEDARQTEVKKTLRECVRLATVDSFQGEEAEVVIISTVRNNPDGRTGFLKTDNRVNVMLSRAKHGMYIFGSSSTILLNDQESLLGKAVQTLRTQKLLGSGMIQIRCDRHPAKEIIMADVSNHAEVDFDVGICAQGVVTTTNKKIDTVLSPVYNHVLSSAPIASSNVKEYVEKFVGVPPR